MERGQLVKVVGLEQAVEFNGMTGKVESINEAGRIVVSFQDYPATSMPNASAAQDARRSVCILPEHLEASFIPMLRAASTRVQSASVLLVCAPFFRGKALPHAMIEAPGRAAGLRQRPCTRFGQVRQDEVRLAGDAR